MESLLFQWHPAIEFPSELNSQEVSNTAHLLTSSCSIKPLGNTKSLRSKPPAQRGYLRQCMGTHGGSVIIRNSS